MLSEFTKESIDTIGITGKVFNLAFIGFHLYYLDKVRQQFINNLRCFIVLEYLHVPPLSSREQNYEEHLS